jgi:hypothetical protein
MSVTRPALPMTGGCPCGAIRYEIASFPLLLYTCNCTNCQRTSGSAFALNMPVVAKDFHILQGEGMASPVPDWSGRHVMVLRRLRRPNLRRTRWASAIDQHSRRNA